MEHTGMYWRPVAMALKRTGFFVSVVNAKLMILSILKPQLLVARAMKE